jgi:hypothetical protein
MKNNVTEKIGLTGSGYIDNIGFYCKNCKVITKHICDQELGNYHCNVCQLMFGARAPRKQIHKNYFKKPKNQREIQYKSRIITR